MRLLDRTSVGERIVGEDFNVEALRAQSFATCRMDAFFQESQILVVAADGSSPRTGSSAGRALLDVAAPEIGLPREVQPVRAREIDDLGISRLVVHQKVELQNEPSG